MAKTAANRRGAGRARRNGWHPRDGTLDLSNKGLTVWPTQMLGSLGSQIRVLNLSKNQLTSIPGAELAKLTSLEVLYVECSSGALKELPPEIGRLARLQKLSVQGNQLAALPAEIGLLANLHELDVRDNRLRELPPEIGRLAHVRLHVGGNPLRSMPKHARVSGDAALAHLRSLFASPDAERAGAAMAGGGAPTSAAPASDSKPPEAAAGQSTAGSSRPAAAQLAQHVEEQTSETQQQQPAPRQTLAGQPKTPAAPAPDAEVEALRSRLAASKVVITDLQKRIAEKAKYQLQAERAQELEAANGALEGRLAEAAEKALASEQQQQQALAEAASRAQASELQLRRMAAAMQEQARATLEQRRAMHEQQQKLAAEGTALRGHLRRLVETEMQLRFQVQAADHRQAVLQNEISSLQKRLSEANERLALYEGGAGPGGPGAPVRRWSEAELAVAAQRLKAAARRLSDLRFEAKVESAVEERVKRRRLESLSAFECTICCEEQEVKKKRVLTNCGHVFCAACAGRLAECATCRKPVTGTSLIFE
eukprot:tig00000826_g4581.t1